MDILSRVLAEDTVRVILDYFGYKELLIRFWLRDKLVIHYNVRVLGQGYLSEESLKKKINYLT